MRSAESTLIRIGKNASIVPFLAAFTIGVVILIVWPGIALWPPRLLYS